MKLKKTKPGTLVFLVIITIVGSLLLYKVLNAYFMVNKYRHSIKVAREDEAKYNRQLIISNQMSEEDKGRVLECSLMDGDMETAKLILKNAPLDPNNIGDKNLLFSAATAKKNRMELLSLLMESGLKDANVNIPGLLHWIALKDCADSAEYLIKRGADVNFKDQYLITPLHVCAETGSPQTAKVLLKNKADVYAKDKNGKTPLDVALEPPGSDRVSESGKRKVAALLRQYIKKSKESATDTGR